MSGVLAALPMYDWPEERAATDALWAAILTALGDEGIAAPERLARDVSLWDGWLSPDLVLGQACSLPYRTRLHDKVTLIGAFDHGVEGAPPGHYRSVLVVRAEGGPRDLAEATRGALAFNGFDSQSGWAAAEGHARSRGLTFQRFLHTGSHRESARAVALGHAEIAALDAVTWRLIRRHEPEVAASLSVLDMTEATPGLPLIAAPRFDAEGIRRALASAVTRLDPDLRERMGLRGFSVMDRSEYLAMSIPPTPSQDVPEFTARRPEPAA